MPPQTRTHKPKPVTITDVWELNQIKCAIPHLVRRTPAQLPEDTRWQVDMEIGKIIAQLENYRDKLTAGEGS